LQVAETVVNHERMSSSTFRWAKLLSNKYWDSYMKRIHSSVISHVFTAAYVRPYLPSPRSASSTVITASHYVFLISNTVTAAGTAEWYLTRRTATRSTEHCNWRLLSSVAAAVQQRGLIAVRCPRVLWVCCVQFLHFKTLNCCDAPEGE
jgi:hypothetical protein